jgi:hypothetical protein
MRGPAAAAHPDVSVAQHHAHSGASDRAGLQPDVARSCMEKRMCACGAAENSVVLARCDEARRHAGFAVLVSDPNPLRVYGVMPRCPSLAFRSPAVSTHQRRNPPLLI